MAAVNSTAEISVIIPTYQRVDKLHCCLEKLANGCFLISEILIHIEPGDLETRSFLESNNYSGVNYMQSTSQQGPGGARTKLIKLARSHIIASFDDDSWPLDPSYFQVAANLFAAHPQVAVLSAQEIRSNSTPLDSNCPNQLVSCFQNCACLIRRDAFLQTRGYLPLRYAYGMEEADVALQLLDRGWQILEVPQLRVFHDSELTHHASPAVNAAHITNTALLAYLRYPTSHWLLGMAQVLNRVRYSASVGRWPGIGQGLWQIPGTLWKYRHHRHPVQPETIAHSRQLARQSSLAS